MKPQAAGEPPRKRRKLQAGANERTVSLLVAIGVVLAIAYGWLHRADRIVDPEHGLGYALGIIGGSMMLLLLGYPVRKRTRARAMGSVGFWFRFHMLLGVLGPLAILYHSQFSFGSLNSAFAMSAMIIVATSGLVGRFLYSRVHVGYSGRKLELRSLKGEMDELIHELAERRLADPAALSGLEAVEAHALAAGRDFWSSASAVVRLGIGTRAGERRLLAALPNSDRAVRERVALFFEAARRAGEFAFYDRLLRLWHLLHLPLFILLVAAAVLHIVAVHMY